MKKVDPGNPLGVIALFISLIYGMASALLGYSADKLSQCERWPIIWFVVSFPVLVLAVFCYLVVKHHGKLYSPKDFSSDAGFLETLSPKEASARKRDEAVEFAVDAEAAVASAENDTIPSPSIENQTAGAASAEPIDEPAVAEEVGNDRSDSSPLDYAVQAGNGLKTFTVASIADELTAITRYIASVTQPFSYPGTIFDIRLHGSGAVFDAAYVDDNCLHCLEVKYIPIGMMVAARWNDLRQLCIKVKDSSMARDVKVRIVIVHNMTPVQLHRARMTEGKYFSDLNFVTFNYLVRKAIPSLEELKDKGF
ncbi:MULTISPECIES: hypothetical protein [Pseudomonas]|uniref:hypothetical protein n=1 Tax=Pseudomonas nitroreducens TaxID=46680 RepID=UPI001E33873F|nr:MULTISPECIES: hypothetical protein [Pseudomonas]MCE4073509.1 hypothetical protein [Pseudomonas nitritireducens]MCE4079748.1 hypothetical protein [Pseudomonas nitroreducens]